VHGPVPQGSTLVGCRQLHDPQPRRRFERALDGQCVGCVHQPHDHLAIGGRGKCRRQRQRQDQRKDERPEDGLGFTKELAHPGQRQLDER
jgi:hypothetical protein